MTRNEQKVTSNEQRTKRSASEGAKEIPLRKIKEKKAKQNNNGICKAGPWIIDA